ncbi:MAG: hypothetical protein WC351_04975 [Candidatus Izemoplasmatales bacterium]|jgi:hypothetical protein
MIKKRMTLSLVALISSVFLFVLASFAWMTLSQVIQIDTNFFNLIDVKAEVTLEVSYDGENYTVVDAIVFDQAVPGSTIYYRISVHNTGNVPSHIQLAFYGFSDAQNDETVPYDDSRSLREVLLVSTENNINDEVIDQVAMVDLMYAVPSGDYSTAYLYVLGAMLLPVAETGVVELSFQVSPSAGNDYQNLALSINRIIVAATKA